jgi:phage terminase Nu1 subunit (DNA packaging protein)
MKENSPMIYDTPTVADFFGVSSRALQLWGQAGCPKAGRGRWDLRAVFNWYIQNIVQDRIESGADDVAMKEAKLRYWNEKATFEEIRNKKELGELMPKAEIAVEWVARVIEVKNGLMGLAYRLPPLISGKADRDVRDIVKLNVRQLLENFSRGGRFCHPEDEKRRKK